METYALASKVNKAASELITQLQLYHGYLSSEVEYSIDTGEHHLVGELNIEMAEVSQDIIYLDKFMLHEDLS